MHSDEHGPSPAVTVLEREAGVDWVRVVFADAIEKHAAFAVTERAWERDKDEGHKVKPWRFQGYRGWMTPTARAGSMEGRLLVESSGKAASTFWTRLASCGGRATRLDVQATVLLSQSVPAFGMRFLKHAATTRSRPQRKRPKRGYQRDTDGLWHGTVGRRTAPRYIRVYDKGVESKTYALGRLWRVEVEAKLGLAEAMWKTIKVAKEPATFCYGQCRAQLLSAGCSWPSIVHTSTDAPIRAPRKPESQAPALLAWLKATVAPTLPRVLAEFSDAEVIAALGMGDVWCPF